MDYIFVKRSWVDNPWLRKKPQRMFWLLDLIANDLRDYSLRRLGERWGISHNEVRRFLEKIDKIGITTDPMAVQNDLLR